MRLVSIRLNNVRRFTAPVEIAGIRPGLNVLSAPNESGKSTVFDALQALFFTGRKSQAKEVRALAPHAGGDPEVAAEIEQNGQIYLVEKTWKKGGRGEVRVFRDGALLHQADDAEAWLADLVKAPKDGGPAGMLWVRQGLLGFDDGKDTETARRDLASSVTGEIEAMTGGRQMEALRAQCRSDLDRYVTTRGARKGGPLALAEEAVETLEAREAELRQRAEALRGDIDRRAALRRELQGLQDPDEAEAFRLRLAEATAALETARRHADDLDRAKAAEHSARLALENRRAQVATLEGQIVERREAERLLGEAAEGHTSAEATLAGAEAAHAVARAKHADATRAAEAAALTHRKTMTAERAARADEQRREIQSRLTEAQAQRAAVERLGVEARRGIDGAALERIEQLALDVSVARKMRDAASAAITMRYVSGRTSGVSLEGEPLVAETRVPIPDGAKLEIDGIGTLQVHPGSTANRLDVENAEAALAAELETRAVETLDEARVSARNRAKAQAALREAEAALRLVAPDGIVVLENALAALPAPVEADTALPPVEQAEMAETAARAGLQEATARLEALRDSAEAARQAEIRASAQVEAIAARLERARLALSEQADPDATLAERKSALPPAEAALADAEARHAALAASAPDLAAAQATLQRAQSAIRAVEERARDIEKDLAGLDQRIAVQSGEAVDEELAEVSGRLEAARVELAATEFEVAVLRRLDAALEKASSEARDRYVAPVLAQLAPLVRMIWPDAELRFDAETMLPSGLVRTGTEEPFDVLSGGTKEQIALLVRLAFARILARSGTPAPVILDDAIVYTDDERIEAIFDALTRQAADLQIIVLSCRQKAFRGLGGEALAIRPVAD